MTDSAKAEGPPNPGRRRLIKAFGAGAAAGAGLATGAIKLADLSTSGKPEQANSAKTPANISSETPIPAPTPDSSSVKGRTWNRNKPDGTFAYTYPITPEERKDLERDVETVGRAVKEVLDVNTLKAQGLDVDQTIADMKAWDDKKISSWAHRSGTDRGRIEPDLEEVYLTLGETGISAWYIDNVKTGEFGAVQVSLHVDENGKYVNYDDSSSNATSEGLVDIPAKLMPLVKPPNGASDKYSLAKLFYKGDVQADEKGKMQTIGINSFEYPTNDGQQFSLSIGRLGRVYGVNITQHKTDVNLTHKGIGGELKLP